MYPPFAGCRRTGVRESRWLVFRTMEFGPRALGGTKHPRRSPQSQDAIRNESQNQISRIIPAVCAVGAARETRGLFRMDVDSPYMLLVRQSGRSAIAMNESKKRCGESTTQYSTFRYSRHYSRRLFGESPDRASRTRIRDTTSLLEAFGAEDRLLRCSSTRPSMFEVNRSVCSPQDAYRCFMRTEMDVLVLENCVLYKANRSHSPRFGLEKGI